MGQASDVIEQHIAEQRQRLDHDLRQLETKVKKTTDSALHNTAFLAGVAVVSGVLLALLFRRWFAGRPEWTAAL